MTTPLTEQASAVVDSADQLIECNVVTGSPTASIFVDGGRPNSLPNFSNLAIIGNACKPVVVWYELGRNANA